MDDDTHPMIPNDPDRTGSYIWESEETPVDVLQVDRIAKPDPVGLDRARAPMAAWVLSEVEWQDHDAGPDWAMTRAPLWAQTGRMLGERHVAVVPACCVEPGPDWTCTLRSPNGILRFAALMDAMLHAPVRRLGTGRHLDDKGEFLIRDATYETDTGRCGCGGNHRLHIVVAGPYEARDFPDHRAELPPGEVLTVEDVLGWAWDNGCPTQVVAADAPAGSTAN